MLNKFLLSHWKIVVITTGIVGLAWGIYYILYCLPPLPKTTVISIPLDTFRL